MFMIYLAKIYLNESEYSRGRAVYLIPMYQMFYILRHLNAVGQFCCYFPFYSGGALCCTNYDAMVIVSLKKTLITIISVTFSTFRLIYIILQRSSFYFILK